MPIHDWTRVDAGIFHAFHHSWIEEIARYLNRGRLPPDYYALQEQFTGGVNPDVLTLQGSADLGASVDPPKVASPGDVAVLQAPRLQPVAETDMAFYRRKQKSVVVRHVSRDRVVAMIEIISPGNKAARNPLQAFLHKTAELLDNGVHLLIVDLFPPGRRDPDGMHGEIWQEIAGEEYRLPSGKPLTLAAYEAGDLIRAYVVHTDFRETLPDMPLFLEPGLTVTAELEMTYNAAFTELPQRWKRVLE